MKASFGVIYKYRIGFLCLNLGTSVNQNLELFATGTAREGSQPLLGAFLS